MLKWLYIFRLCFLGSEQSNNSQKGQFPEHEHFKHCVYDVFLCHTTSLMFEIWLTSHPIYKKQSKPHWLSMYESVGYNFSSGDPKTYCGEKRLKTVILIPAVGITPFHQCSKHQTYLSNKKRECFSQGRVPISTLYWINCPYFLHLLLFQPACPWTVALNPILR